MKIQTVIIEDEVNARKALMNMLSFYCPTVEVTGQADTIERGTKLIQGLSPDLLLLDVQLPDGTGFDLIKKIKKRNFKLVFITAYDEYALKAIKLSALDYLLKPVKPNELTGAINKVAEAMENEERISLQLETCIENVHHTNQNKKIILNTSDNIHVLEVKKIIRCEASENYTNIFVKDKPKIMLAKTLKEFEEMLTTYGFFRIHQSHLINLDFVDSYVKKGAGVALLKTGDRIPVSTRRKEGFLKALETIL